MKIMPQNNSFHLIIPFNYEDNSLRISEAFEKFNSEYMKSDIEFPNYNEFLKECSVAAIDLEDNS